MTDRPIISTAKIAEQFGTDPASLAKVQGPDLSAETVVRLLDLLSSDDGFRAQFEEDSGAALASIGLPAEAAMCLHFKRLASKEVIRGSFDTLRLVLTGNLAFNVHDLDAGPLH